MTTAFGFFGKIPDRGDFIRHGLPQSFLAPLDAWWQRVLPGSRTVLGDAWSDAWMEAPVWRFAFAPGVCGPAAAGLWMPSTDKAGRLFPLTFAVTAAGWADVAPYGAFLDAAEQAGLRALEDTATPEAITAALAAAAAPGGDTIPAPTPGTALWWTTGSPRVQPTRLSTTGLPSSLQFAAMLDEAGALQSGHR